MRTQTFNEWLAAVDYHLINQCSMDHTDLPDWQYREAYTASMAPQRAAERALGAAINSHMGTGKPA